MKPFESNEPGRRPKNRLALSPEWPLYELNVQVCSTIAFKKRGIGTSFVAGLMLVLWLGATALAMSPQLHQRLHKDSKSPTHECVVTLFSKGHLVAGTTGAFALPLIPIFFGSFLLAEFFRFSLLDFRLSPSRAPPGAVSPNTVVG